MPAERTGQLAVLVGHLRAGRDLRRSASGRAESLWAAAVLLRSAGLELLGTELGPDAAICGGQFPAGWLGDERDNRPQDPLAAPAKDEAERAAAHHPDPDRRFHYRFVAARLGWEAAELMPDQDPATARVLCDAGTWIKDLDANEADRFYKALVRRCRRTPLGAEADRLRWFPKPAANAS